MEHSPNSNRALRVKYVASKPKVARQPSRKRPQQPVQMDCQVEEDASQSFSRSFRNDEHREKYMARHCNKLNVTGAVDLTSLSRSEELVNRLSRVLNSMRWKTLGAFAELDVSPSCVKDFCSTLQVRQDLSLQVFVGNDERVIEPSDWGAFFGIPFDEGDYQGYEDFDFDFVKAWAKITYRPYTDKSKSMGSVEDPLHRILLDLSTHTIFCRPQGYSKWEIYDMWTLYHALRSKLINVTLLMFLNMESIARDASKNLPYANLITHFCRQNLTGYQCDPVDKGALSHMGFKLQDGVFIKTVRPSSEDHLSQFQAFNARHDSIDAWLIKVESDIGSLRSSVKGVECLLHGIHSSIQFGHQQIMEAVRQNQSRPTGSQFHGVFHEKQFGYQVGGSVGNMGNFGCSSSGLGQSSSSFMGYSSSGSMRCDPRP